MSHAFELGFVAGSVFGGVAGAVLAGVIVLAKLWALGRAADRYVDEFGRRAHRRDWEDVFVDRNGLGSSKPRKEGGRHA